MSDEDPVEAPVVVPIHPGIEIPDENGANPAIVRILRMALEDAERGEITAFALSTVSPNGTATRYIHFGEKAIHLLGAVSLMHYRIQESFTQGDDQYEADKGA